MDWKILAITFGSVFLAELGDKTQLATASLAASSRRPWEVLAGAAAALVASSIIAVTVGTALAEVVPAVWLRRGAAALFIGIGVLLLFWGPR